MAYNSYPLLLQRAPAATPFTFTTIAELSQVPLPELMGNEADASIQNSIMDVYVVSTLQRRKPLALKVNYLPSDGTQDHLTGLLAARISGSFDGYKFLHAASSLTIIASGQVTGVSPVTPNEGLLQGDITIRLSGAMFWNGLRIG